jgi:hypothetical protein
MSAHRMLILIAVTLLTIPASVFAALEVTCGATLGPGGTYVLTEDLLCPHAERLSTKDPCGNARGTVSPLPNPSTWKRGKL